MESNESMAMKQNEKINRRERKMQERWTITTKNDNNNSDQLPTKTFLGVEFPPIAVLRRKFSSLPPPPPPPILNPLPIKKKDSSSNKTKTLLNNIDDISSTLLKPSMSLPNQVSLLKIHYNINYLLCKNTLSICFMIYKKLF